jgi:ATP-dependent exoDNAse (exonuclease V) beta subunit
MEGIALHALLEKIDFQGLEHENLDARLGAAAEGLIGMNADLLRTAREALARLLTLPLGRKLSAGATLHREVTFSLRVPLLEIADLLPDLREEILSSPDWVEALEPPTETRSGSPLRLRARAASPDSSGEPWVLVQGRIDLVLRDPERVIVLDWKSDRVADDRALEELLARYGGQLAIYRRAAAAAFGGPAVSFLYFLRPGILREV